MDLNNDGHDDILSGSYSRSEPSMAGLFQVLWGQADGTFKKAAVLTGTDDEPLIIPVEGDDWTKNICTRPAAVDWDADGDLDLVVGNFVGTFYLFTGEGDGRFAPEPTQIVTAADPGSGAEEPATDQDGSPLRIEGYHSDPFVVDWDSDGDLDLLSGSSNGGVQWAENVAGSGKQPLLKQFETLIEAGPQVAYGEPLAESDLKGPQSSTRVWADDVNEDGKLDLLVGDNVTLLAPAAELSVEAFKEKFAKWQEAANEASQAIRAEGEPDERQEALQRLQKVFDDRSSFMQEERTGFVWLYLQK